MKQSTKTARIEVSYKYISELKCGTWVLTTTDAKGVKKNSCHDTMKLAFDKMREYLDASCKPYLCESMNVIIEKTYYD